MKINILVVVRWPVGGIRTYLRYVYGNFNPENYSITLIAPKIAETIILLEDLAKFNLNYIELNSNPSSIEFTKAIIMAMRKTKYDIVHSHGLTAGIYSIIPAKLFSIVHLLTIHDVFTEKQFLGIIGTIKRKMLSLFLSNVTKIHAVSNDAKSNLLDYLPSLINQNVVAIMNGIDIVRFDQTDICDLRKEYGLCDDVFLIGFLGRFMAQKGFRYLADALTILLSSYRFDKKPVILAFGEDGFIREEKQYIQSKNLTDNIIFCPFTSNVAPILKGLDVVVMPSLWEACGLLAMEAMVAGVPLIGTNCIGLREVLEDTPCKIVPPRNTEALVEAIRDEINNSSKIVAQLFVPNARLRFDVNMHSQQIENLISSLLRGT